MRLRTQVVDKIAKVKTGQVAFFADAPVEPVVIEKVTVCGTAKASDESAHTVTVLQEVPRD